MGQCDGGGAIGVVRMTMIPALLASAAIVGCATAPSPPIASPVEVQVPIAAPVYCRIGNLPQPALPIGALKADSAPADTIRAYAATVAILKGAVRERDLAIAGCAPPSGSPPASPTDEGTTSGGAQPK